MFKKKSVFRSSLFIFAGCLMFAACSDDNKEHGGEPTPEPLADYTIMMYGCGGGNLDVEMLYNLGQVAGYGYSSQVQFTAKLKFSDPYQQENMELYGGTRLYTLTPDGMKDECVGSQGYRLDDPKNLADFIINTKKRLPAKQYILVLWNHGSEFSIEDQLVNKNYPARVTDARGIVYDDNTGENISIFEQEEAFKRANVKLDLLYWDVCLMHTIENLCQIKDYTRYVMGAGHLTSGLGGNYASLMHALENNSDLLKAMQEYIPATVDHWVAIEGADDGKDLALSDMNYVDIVAQNMKDCIGSLITYRDGLEPGSQDELNYHFINGTSQKENGTRFPYYSSGGVLYYFASGYNSVDMSSAFVRIGNSSMDGQLSAQITKLKMSIDKMIPISHCAGTPNYLPRISLGINWIDKMAFEEYFPDYPIHTLEKLYSNLRFDQIAGWSRFLKTNIRKKVSVRIVNDPQTGEPIDEFYEEPSKVPNEK